jgi:hypothetical protein
MWKSIVYVPHIIQKEWLKITHFCFYYRQITKTTNLSLKEVTKMETIINIDLAFSRMFNTERIQ